MDRRVFLGTLGLNVLAAPLTAQAQRAGKMPLVGVLHTSSPTPGALGPLGPDTPRDLTVSALRLGLRDLGYVEGQTIALEYRFAEGRPETLPRLATELVQLKVDVLVASGPAAIRAARAVTSSIPIVGQDYESDPVQSGFVRSFSRPGGNLTGLFADLPSLAGKWLELLREAVPGLTRVAALWDPTTGPSQTSALRAAARGLGVEIRIVGMSDPEHIGSLLTTAMKARPGALVQLSSPSVASPRHARQIADFAAQHRLPSISLFPTFTDAGGLMSYGPSRPRFLVRLAAYVDKILKGAKPAELPVERPDKFDLVINLKTATALGLTIPRTLLLRTDHVIE